MLFSMELQQYVSGSVLILPVYRDIYRRACILISGEFRCRVVNSVFSNINLLDVAALSFLFDFVSFRRINP